MGVIVMDKEDEQRLIDEFIRENGITKCQTAFVARSQQAEIPDRTFVHSDVSYKTKWRGARSKWDKRRKMIMDFARDE